MVMLKYKGTHQPKDMLIDVKESKVKRLLDSGEYALVNSIPKEQVSIKDKKDDAQTSFKKGGYLDDDNL